MNSRHGAQANERMKRTRGVRHTHETPNKQLARWRRGEGQVGAELSQFILAPVCHSRYETRWSKAWMAYNPEYCRFINIKLLTVLVVLHRLVKCFWFDDEGSSLTWAVPFDRSQCFTLYSFNFKMGQSAQKQHNHTEKKLHSCMYADKLLDPFL